MRILCRSRAFREGRIGRYRTYTCRVCGEKFQTPDTRISPLPESERICPECKAKAERDLDLVVMVSIRQGIFFRPDIGVYLNDLDYWKYLEYGEAQHG